MTLKKILPLLLLAILPSLTFSQVLSQFRGPGRTGIYPETGLMREWPETGPLLLWKSDSIGNGYSSPAIAGNRIFIAGETDSTGFITALGLDGKLIWKIPTGREWTENFSGSRCTPTVVENRLYYLSGIGKLLCLNTSDGKEIWSRDLIKDFHGTNVRFGYSESLLVDNDIVYCSPGGRDTNMVALDNRTGALLWTAKVMGDTTAYGAPLLITHGSRKILIVSGIHHLAGIDAAGGKLLWSYKYDRSSDIHCNLPFYEGGAIYYNDRGGNGFVKLLLNEEGSAVQEAWRNFKGGNVQGGFVKLGKWLYGSRYTPKRFESVDAETGLVYDSLKFECGVTIYADSMLYVYGEGGKTGLLKPDNGKLSLVSSFQVSGGTREHFAHPVIAGGRLYVRHGKILMVYSIRREKGG